ncbi:lipopolysaccharide biosynthesis protein [Mycobacterium sp. 2YAF39]|uniref:lipopolysaccharide biosynthesis protein n=1 Tax=Mycobacterium sp. 2YAF39 TaxID=3233033 RepID=UPI003F99CCB4
MDAAATKLFINSDRSSATGGSRSIGRLLLVSGGARLIVLPVTALAQVLVARIITSAVGIEQFGVVMLVATLSMPLAQAADLGAGPAVSTARAQVDESGEEQFRRTMLTAMRATLLSAAVLCLAAVVLALLNAWPSLLGVHGVQFGRGLDVAAALTLVTFAIGIPFSLGANVLRGSGRMHQATVLAAVSAPVSLALTVGLYLLHAPTLAYALAIPIGGLVSLMCGALAVRRTDAGFVKGLLSQVFRRDRFPGMPIWATAAPWIVVQLGLPLALYSDRIVLSHRVDLTSLSNYSYAAQLYLPLESVVVVAALALWPHFAVEKQTTATRRKTWLTSLAILGAAGVIAAIGFVLLSPFVIGWMSTGAATPPTSLLAAFGLLLVVQSLHVSQGIMLITPKGLRFQAVCVVALVVTNLPLSWVLAPILGPAGPVLASALTVAVCQLIPGLIVANRITSTPATELS